MTTPETLNAAQIKAIEQSVQQQVAAYVKALDLRKWAVEQAVKVCSSIQDNEPMPMAEAIYAFITQPMGEINVKIT